MERERKIAAVKTNLAYLFADLLESSLMDMNESIKKAGFQLVHEDKRNFNTAIKAIKRLKSKVDALPSDQQDGYGDSSDKIYQLILLIVDRCTKDDVNIKSLAYQLVGLPSLLGLETDLSVFENEK